MDKNNSNIYEPDNVTQTLGEEDNQSDTLNEMVGNKHFKAVSITGITLAIYVFNILCIFLLRKTWTSRRWQDNTIVLGLFTTDLLNGRPSLLRQPHFAEVHLFFFFMWGPAAFYMLAGASVVQALAVLRPLKFSQEVTPRRMLVSILFVWSIGAVQATA